MSRASRVPGTPIRMSLAPPVVSRRRGPHDRAGALARRETRCVATPMACKIPDRAPLLRALLARPSLPPVQIIRLAYTRRQPSMKRLDSQDGPPALCRRQGLGRIRPAPPRISSILRTRSLLEGQLCLNPNVLVINCHFLVGNCHCLVGNCHVLARNCRFLLGNCHILVGICFLQLPARNHDCPLRNDTCPLRSLLSMRPPSPPRLEKPCNLQSAKP